MKNDLMIDCSNNAITNIASATFCLYCNIICLHIYLSANSIITILSVQVFQVCLLQNVYFILKLKNVIFNHE